MRPEADFLTPRSRVWVRRTSLLWRPLLVCNELDWRENERTLNLDYR